MNPEYPIYIISKSRWDSRYTSKTLEMMKVPYSIVVEPQEYDNYAAVIDPKKILVLPFSNLGQGSIPARNWVWEHAISTGAKRHWILDDNIKDFYRLHTNRKFVVESGTILKVAEDFIDRYENIGMAGLNYDYLADARQGVAPYFLNVRIYSCILLLNSIEHRWRGRYNEDTDLSIRILGDGWCTVLFNAFLAGKQPTLTMKGGNADELYAGDGRLQMAKSLIEQHPFQTSVTWKFKRWQHTVNYQKFRYNRLRRRPDVKIPQGINNFGMKLCGLEEVEAMEREGYNASK